MEHRHARTLALRPAQHALTLGRSIAAWPLTSQQGARRNAMLASTEIRRRRQEQQDVEAFLLAHRPRRRPVATG